MHFYIGEKVVIKFQTTTQADALIKAYHDTKGIIFVNLLERARFIIMLARTSVSVEEKTGMKLLLRK